MKKYEFTGETKIFAGTTLKRIKRAEDGLLGGWLESENNLSHVGACFVYGNARVFGNARVSGNAQVYDNARVFGNAWVSGNAQVYGNTKTLNCIHIQQAKHSITVTHDYIFIGCQGHTWRHWKQHINAIGNSAGYSTLEIKQVWVILNVVCEQISGTKLSKYKGK